MTKKEAGEFCKRHRKQKLQTIEDVSEKTGLSCTTIVNIENGFRCSVTSYYRYANHLGMNLELTKI